MFTEQDLAFDRQHIWHPYTSITNPMPTFAVKRAHGVRLVLNDDTQLIDGMASWWSCIHGYNHPKMNAAIETQTAKMAHVMFGGLTHEPAIKLCKTLLKMTPEPLQHIFIADSGSIAVCVEVALKMALQYWQGKGQRSKTKILTVKQGYYGDTFGAMSLCDPVNSMHHLFPNILPKQFFVKAPAMGVNVWEETHIEPMKQMLYEQHEHIAAVIIEPIVQGAGGMRFYSPKYLQRLRELCDEKNVLLIFDEIATGFGRTGHLFASFFANVFPDIMCVGKALTGGYTTLAATLCTTKVGEGISRIGPLMHGPTFMANPLACSIACASLSILADGKWKQQVLNIEEQLKVGLKPCKDFKRCS